MRLRYRLCALSVCLALTSCLSTVKGEKHKHFWYGSAPFEKRQTLEAYKRDTIPAIEKFLTRISQAGAANSSSKEEPKKAGAAKTTVGMTIGARTYLESRLTSMRSLKQVMSSWSQQAFLRGPNANMRMEMSHCFG